MFQTPQQRESSGIMTGVVPIRGYAEGGEVIDFIKGQFEQDDERVNVRDFTDFFIVDPSDPVDVGMASATATLMAFPPAAALAALARMGYKGKKAIDKVNKLKELQKKMATPKKEDAGIIRKVAKPIGTTMAAREIPALPEYPQDARDIKESVMGIMETISEPEEMADGGIASLAVNMSNGGKPSKLDVIKKAIEEGPEALQDLINRGIVNANDLLDLDLKKVDIPGAKKDVPTGPRAVEETDIMNTTITPKMSPKDLGVDEVPKVGKQNIPAKLRNVSDDSPITEGKKSGSSLGSKALKTIGGIGTLVGAGYFGSDILEALGMKIPAPEEDDSIARPAPSNVPVLPRSNSQFAKDQQDIDAIAEFSAAENEEANKKPNRFKRFLLGEDEKFGGDRGAIDFIRGEPADFLSRSIEKLGDPRVRYQLSQAAKATEGFVPRNFFTDVEEAGQAYDDMMAKREYIEAQTEAEQTSDMEQLATFYASNLPGFDELSEEQQSDIVGQVGLTLFEDQNAQKEAATLIEVLKILGRGEDSKAFIEKFASTESNLGSTLGDMQSQIDKLLGR
tara:strand:- start:4049 stop:5740 length:1692 start_codon:yes stop_codon:yes gene_type:complete